tara:strand:- start:271 stop:1632 length:1362 start_codon:yes stop_codon:yes gene_type:complete
LHDAFTCPAAISIMKNPSLENGTALTQTSLRRHIPVLDGIRGLAILMVLFHHGADMSSAGLFDDIALWGLHFGGRGVDLFFVLSGFLITGIIADTKGQKGYFISFYARRILRIFPLYYALIILSFFILPNVGSFLAGLESVPVQTAEVIQGKLDRFGQVNDYQVYYWLFFSNFVIAHLNEWGHGILGVSWSLAIEEQFYLLWPFLFFFLDAKRMKIVCLFLLLFSPLFRVIVLATGKDPFFGGDITVIDLYVLTPGRLEGLVLGALLALHLRTGKDELEPERKLRALVKPALFFAIVGIAGALIADMPHYFGEHNSEIESWEAAAFGFTSVAFGLAGVVVLALAARPGTWWYAFWTSRFMCSFGKYSYAIYLTHLPVRALIRDMIYGPASNGDRFGTAWIEFPKVMGSEFIGQILFFIPMLAVCWLVGWLSWNLFEKQVLKLKKYFPYGRKKA